jgi:MtrB/PioB family decaheme-associated outer membrane protein
MTTLRFAVAIALAGGLAVNAPSSPARAAEGDATFGGQWWNQTAPDAKYQEFRQVSRGGFLENFVIREWSGRTSVALWGANALHGDQAAKLTVADGVRWRADFGYTQIPHQFSFTSRSPWSQSSPGSFTLPDLIQSANQTTPANYSTNMRDVLANSPLIGLGFDTDISSARLRARPTRDWQLDARGTVRERSGQKPYAMTFGFSTAIEIPEPIDQRMVDADVIANYQHKDMTAQVDVGVSTFTNHISTLRVDNPKRATDVVGGDGPRVGALDLYPDNQVIRGTLALGYELPKRTSVTATVGMSQGKQDDKFLPYTNNSALAQSRIDSLPVRSLDGKAVQLNGDVRLSTRPIEGVEGALRFHYTDYDNQTEEHNFSGQSPYDVSWQPYAIHPNHVLSNKQLVSGGDLDYAVTPQIKLGGTVEYRTRDRTEREVEKDNETVYGGHARMHLMDNVQLQGRYTHGDRKLDAFNNDEYMIYVARTRTPVTGIYDSLVQGEQTALRRFDVANRVQDMASGGVSYALGERADLSASYAYLKNDYKDSQFGLQKETQQTVATDATIHVNERLDLNGGYGYGVTETNQASRVSNAATLSTLANNNWFALLKDTDVFYFAGFEWTPKEKLTLVGNYQLSRDLSLFDFTDPLNTSIDLPGTIYRRHEAQLDARWQWIKSTVIIGRWGWEEYDSIDWATNNVPYVFPLVGASTGVFLGDSSQGYKAHRLALLVKHSF